MGVIELIQDVRKENTILLRMTEELERLRSICQVTGVNLEGERVSGSHNNSRVEQAYLNYIEYKDKLDTYMANTKEKRAMLNNMIDTLERPQSIDVMYKYCLANMTMQEIAYINKCSRSNVYKIYSNAVDELQAKVDKSGQNYNQIDN